MTNRAINSNLDTKLSLPKVNAGALAWDIGCYQGLAIEIFVLKGHCFIRTIRFYTLDARWELTAPGLTTSTIFFQDVRQHETVRPMSSSDPSLGAGYASQGPRVPRSLLLLRRLRRATDQG